MLLKLIKLNSALVITVDFETQSKINIFIGD